MTSCQLALQISWFSRALHRYRRGYEFDSRSSFFLSAAYVDIINCDGCHHFIFQSAVHIYEHFTYSVSITQLLPYVLLSTSLLKVAP